MRLAVFTNRFPGRLNTFFARDMRALLESGIELDIFAFYPPNLALWACVPDLLGPDILPRNRVHHLSPSHLAWSGAPWPAHRAARFARDVAPIVAASARYGPVPAAKSAYASAYAWAAIRRFANVPFDHVLAYWGNHAASVAYLFHRHAVPDVPFSMLVHARMDLYHQPAFLEAKLEYADNILLVCEYNRRYLQEHFPTTFASIAGRVQLHHLGLPLDRIRFEPGQRPLDRLLAVGNLEPLKGHAVLIEAIALLASRGVQVQLDLVGDGPSRGALELLVQRSGLARQVAFRGWLSETDVLSAMRHATLLVHPSIQPDAMPTVVKEGLAIGTPVVASDLAGIPEMLDGGRCGVLVAPGNAAALAGALEELLQNPQRRLVLARAGREHAEAQFDLWRNGRALAERLRATVRQPRVGTTRPTC